MPRLPRLPIVTLLLFTPLLIMGGVLALDWWICLPEGQPSEYVGREVCAKCHEEELKQWTGSDHDLAMDLATSKTVLADFDDVRFTHIAFQDLHRLSDDERKVVTSEVSGSAWALAMQYTPWGDAVQRKLETAVLPLLSKANRADFDATRASPIPVRPCDAMTAQRAIGDTVRRLASEGRIGLDFAVTSRFFRKEGQFFVNTDNRDGQMETLAVKYVFGVRPLQQYLVEFPDGRVQCLPLAWDTESKSWFHLYPGETIPHDDPLHWTGRLQNWNYMCAECHTTNLEKKFDVATNTYHTTWSEIDVSCETCHGPGGLHTKLAESRSLSWDRRHGFGLPNLKDPNARVEIETCAPCHSRRRIVYPKQPAGEPFLDQYMLELLDGELYYADGQILDEDYVFGSFLQSRMYGESVRCSDCHNPHTAKVKFLDNRLCNQCHESPKYDTPQHHHHTDASKPGTLCVECHMPETTYMVVDPRRDHSIRVPRPDLTVSLDIPNACNGCHTDSDKGETPSWAAEQCKTWYGEPKGLSHFAQAFAEGRQGKPSAELALAKIARRKDTSAMIRASAIGILGHYSGTHAQAAALHGLEDPEGLVRVAAIRSLQEMPQDQWFRRLSPLLDDPFRAVRTEAARRLAPLPEGLFSPEKRKAFDRAIDEFLEGQRSLSDQPGSHLNMAVAWGDRGRLGESEKSYRTAIRLDPTFIPARVNLAMLLDRRNQKSAAEEQFREVLKLDAEISEVHYSLGLLIAEEKTRLAEAAKHLQRAAELAKVNPRIYYNLGLALQNLDRADEAEEALKTAYRLAPETSDALYALAILYTQQKQWEQAIRCTDELRLRDPNNQSWRALREHAMRQKEASKESSPRP